MEGPGLDQKQIDACRALSKSIRRDVLKMTWERKAAFIGTSFSCADILGVLYGGIYKKDEDLKIISKGQGASAW